MFISTTEPFSVGIRDQVHLSTNRSHDSIKLAGWKERLQWKGFTWSKLDLVLRLGNAYFTNGRENWVQGDIWISHRSFMIRSCDDWKARAWCLKFFDHFEIWYASHQHCCWVICQFSGAWISNCIPQNPVGCNYSSMPWNLVSKV